MIDDHLLKILCCPESHQPLRWASVEELARVNRQLAAGGLKNKGGRDVSETLDNALIRQDSRILYPVRNQIPLLLVEEGIAL